jgi:hypothetical protein
MAADPFWYNVLESARANVFEWCAATRPRDSDPLAPSHTSLPTLKGVYPSRRETALEPVDLQGRPVEVREPPRAVLEEPVNLRKERAGLARSASAAPLPPWIVARSTHV